MRKVPIRLIMQKKEEIAEKTRAADIKTFS